MATCNIGKEIRMGRLFNKKSNRMVLITIDHGICVSPMKEIANVKNIVREIVKGGADAVLLTPGIAKIVHEELVSTNTSLMMRIDGTATSIGPDLTNDELIYSVEGALQLGADAVATFGVIGVQREAQLSHKIGETAEKCDRLGIPMMVEMIPNEMLKHQFENKANRKWPSNSELVKFSARVAAELGADIVKGYYTGNPKSFKEVIEYCPVPYVVLSGPASNDLKVFLKFIKDAIECGCGGVSVGRNVWTYKNPAAITRAICKIVHENASIEEALKEIK